MIEPDDVLCDRFRIDRLIGVGGMGLVFRAVEIGTEKRVAVKALSEEGLVAATSSERFRREAKLLQKLRHPHVIEVMEVGEHRRVPFYVMELLEGRDLRQEVRARGTIPVDEAAGYVVQASRALAAVHRAGIVHRDLKPQNLFVTNLSGARHVKVLDFGISKSSEEGEATLTATAGVLGTPHYMSPEQILASKAVDARSDIWALGVILHVLVTGRLPFARSSVAAVIAAIPTDPVDPFRPEDAHVPDSLRALLARCLAKDPSARYSNADELVTALLEFAPSGGEIFAPEVNVPSTVPPIVLARRARLSLPAPEAAGAPLSLRPVDRPSDRTIALGPRAPSLDAAPPARSSSIPPRTLVSNAPVREETVPSSRRRAEAQIPSLERSSRPVRVATLAVATTALVLGIVGAAERFFGASASAEPAPERALASGSGPAAPSVGTPRARAAPPTIEARAARPTIEARTSTDSAPSLPTSPPATSPPTSTRERKTVRPSKPTGAPAPAATSTQLAPDGAPIHL